MTHRQLLNLTSALIAAGGLGLLAIAASAARAGVWSAAGFIGACGAVLCAAVITVHFRHQRQG